MAAPAEEDPSQRLVYSYEAALPVYAMAWANREDQPYRMALGSFVEEYKNRLEVIQLNQETGKFQVKCSISHPYPATKIMWYPRKDGPEELLASTAEYMRLFKYNEDNTIRMLWESRTKTGQTENCSPLTSFDWNHIRPELIGTASLDTTVTITNIETKQTEKRLIAHDSEVYDIAWADSQHVFGTVGNDGSVRCFDLRQLKTCTVMYETEDSSPLLRLHWNKHDQNYLALQPSNSNSTLVLDIRMSSAPLSLSAHTGLVNAIAWAPQSACHLVTAGEDSQALIWDLKKKPLQEILSYTAPREIDNLVWGATQPDWIGITCANTVQILRVYSRAV